MNDIIFKYFIGGLFFLGTIIILIILFREYLMMSDRVKFLDGNFEDDLDRLIKEKINKSNENYFDKRRGKI